MSNKTTRKLYEERFKQHFKEMKIQDTGDVETS